MTTICPNCDARFRDPPADIPLSRPMQCSKCEHEWVRLPEMNAPSLVPDMRALVNDTDDAIITNLPVVVEESVQEAVSRTYVDRMPKPVHTKPLPLAPVFGLACLGFLAVALVFKGDILDAVPQAHSAYAAAGLASPAPELSIDGIETTRLEKDGIRKLIIRGEIANVAEHAVPVPPIQLTMRGERNIRLYEWTVSAVKEKLSAGERSRFTAVATDYPGQAVDVEVAFALRKPAVEK